MKKLLIGLLTLSSVSAFAQADILVEAIKLDKYCGAEAYVDEKNSQELFLGAPISKEECEKNATLIQKGLGISSVGYKKMFFYYSDKGNVYGAIVDNKSDLDKKVQLRGNEYDEGYEAGFNSAH
jgi:hypothetical protein